MNCPPLLLRLTISKTEGNGRFVLWLPVFIAWLILAAIFIALLPLILFIAVVAFFFGWARTVFLFIPLFCNVICNLHGLEINVEKKDSTLFLSFR